MNKYFFAISGDARRGGCSRRPEGQPCAQRQAGPGRVERGGDAVPNWTLNITRVDFAKKIIISGWQ